MSDAFTCKVMMLGESKTPARIELLGDKHKRPEPAQHVIEFPGGAVEVSRTTDGNYWAHILINRSYENEDCKGYRSKLGEVIGSRITGGDAVEQITAQEDVEQIAVLIRPL